MAVVTMHKEIKVFVDNLKTSRKDLDLCQNGSTVTI